jgi:beta-glucosidase
MPNHKKWITPEIENKVSILLSQMTLEEKVGQMTQYDWGSIGINPDAGEELRQSMKVQLEKGLIGSIFNISGAEEANRLQLLMKEKSRLGIPLLIGRDVIHGYRTIFPIPLAQGASWNPDLVKRAATVASREASTEGISWIFAPMIDVTRDPRWGRIAESMGEDPYLTGKFAKAWVEGAEYIDWQYNMHTMSCPKHFAAYGFVEAGRDYNTVDVSERVLREVILPPFKEAVEAGALSLMASFNELNGIPACANPFLLTTILREEWGFEGIVVSDYNAVQELMIHGIAATEEEACEISIKAGLDIDMHSGIYMRCLPKLVMEGKIKEELVNRSVRKILAIKYKLGLFEQPFVDVKLKEKVILHSDHLMIARQLARESIVLLKNNDKTLPICKNISSIAVIGPLADNKKDPLGTWAMDGKEGDVVSILEAIRSKVSKDTTVHYAQGCGIEQESEADIERAVGVAGKADFIVIAVGESRDQSGEAHSRTDLGLPGRQKQLIDAISVLGKPMVVVLLNGRPLALPWLQDEAAAILEAWHLGVQSGHAIADVLFGDYNPSGKVTVSFPYDVGQIPIYYYRKNTGRPPAGAMTSKYLDAPVEPLYPFGFGLSYTEFKYDDLQLSKKRIKVGETLKISARITNIGDRAGEEVVQLYVRDVVGSVTRPLKLLRGFKKIKLEQGDNKTVVFELTTSDLVFLDAQMNVVIEPGLFEVWIGPNSSVGLVEQFMVEK